MEEADDKKNLSILNTTKGRVPTLPFINIKNTILGKKYSLSLVFAGDTLSKKLNRTYRNKNEPTNILSFSLSKTEGEIFINLKKARSDAPQFKQTYNKFVGFLFIHGLLHLKGMTHGSMMEKQEQRLKKRFRF